MKIRYTQGPDEIQLGNVVFKIGEAKDVTDALAAQALLPQRVYEYGFEVVPAADPIPAPASSVTPAVAVAPAPEPVPEPIAVAPQPAADPVV